MDITLYEHKIREQKLSRDNGRIYIALEEADKSDCKVIRQMLTHSPDKRLRLMHPIRNTKHRASTSFDFIIVCAILNRLSYVGRRADALALRADERRDKLRKAAVSCK